LSVGTASPTDTFPAGSVTTRTNARNVLLAGDHVYKMDYEPMLQQHVDTGADVTIACLEVPQKDASSFGIMHVDECDRIIGFLEKPKEPPAMPGKPGVALASMGIYVFETEYLIDQLRRDAGDAASSHDSARISFRTSLGTAGPWRATLPNPACVPASRRVTIGAMLEPSTPIMPRVWICVHPLLR